MQSTKSEQPTHLLPRPPLATNNLDANFTVLRELGDAGGGLNNGIAIVRRRTDRLVLVRKKFEASTSSGDSSSKPPRKYWIQEMTLLRTLRHRNVCAFVDGYVTSARACLYVEFCEYGDLTSLVERFDRHREMVPESFIWHVFRGLIKALCYLHYGFWRLDNVKDQADWRKEPEDGYHVKGWERVLHRDVKTPNVFLKGAVDDRLGYPIIKLGDFGLSVGEEDVQYGRESFGGTRGWTPPEAPRE